MGAGAATAKLLLLIKSKADHTFIPVYIKVAKPLTRQIAVGLILLTVSGIAWLLLGYAVTRQLIVKIILVAAIWMLGPVIDKVIEPKFHRLVPGPGEAGSAAFRRSQTQYLTLEVIATLLFYVIIVLWVAR